MEQTSKRKVLGNLLMLWITATAKANPTKTSLLENEVSSSKNIVGIATQVIANALISGQAESSSNYVFSPIGYATILSLLGQGAVGPTKDEIYQVLRQPDNAEEVRNAYRLALSEFAGNDSEIAPQFKTWFYIYRNNTAEEEFKKILTEDYLVEIKDIERFNSNFDTFDYDARTADDSVANNKPTNSKDIIQFDDLKNTEPKDDKGTIEGFDTLKSADDDSSVGQAIADYDQLDKNEKDKVSKFDKSVEDSQYVEAPEIKKEIKEQIAALEEENSEKKSGNKSEGPEKIDLPLKKYMDDSFDSMEIMDAVDSRNFVNRFGRAQPLHLDGDVTSALSGNSIMGRKSNDGPHHSESGPTLESKMLLFNGLYFRGHWATPFSELRDVPADVQFFNALTGPQDVKFMMTFGVFKCAEIPGKQITVVDLPYKNERYSLTVVMPDSIKDMRHFAKDSNINSLNEIIAQLEPSEIQLFMPKFRFESTSRAEKALGKLGLTTLFTSKADLSGLSKDAVNHQIEELVQHVAIRVDEHHSSENALSAGNIHARKASKIIIDKPFFFYVRDVTNDIILSAGKIVEIPVEQEIPISFESV